jgi:hypothetical protein
MFYKINFDFLKSNFDWINLDPKFLVSEYDSVTTKLEYFKLDNYEQFKSYHTLRPYIIPPDSIRIGRITGKGVLLPHKDHNTTAVLNFYISASNDPTIFYFDKPGAKTLRYPGKTSNNIFLPTEVEEVCRFTAEKNTGYLLDVSQIHSVIKSTTEPRIFINYTWRSASFSQVLEGIKSVAKAQQQSTLTSSQ